MKPSDLYIWGFFTSAVIIFFSDWLKGDYNSTGWDELVVVMLISIPIGFSLWYILCRIIDKRYVLTRRENAKN